MKRAKISSLFLAAAITLLLATCSDGMGEGEFATVTIRLGNSDPSRQLVAINADGNPTSETHTYKLFVKANPSASASKIIDMVIDHTTGHLTASGVPTGKKILEVRAYGIADNIWPASADGTPGHPFERENVLRAIGLSGSVTISTNQTTKVSIDLHSALDVSSWEELKWAAESEPDENDKNRKEIIILKPNATTGAWDATSTITIERPIEIRAEGNVTITRAHAAAPSNGFNGPFFEVNFSDDPTNGIINGKLAIGRTLPANLTTSPPDGEPDTGINIGDAITLDGGKWDEDTNPRLTSPLIIANADCTIGKSIILRNNNNYYTANSEGTPGGGVYVNSGTFKLFGQIKNNSAEENGGGVYIKDGSFVMEDGAVIAGNIAKSGSGGGVNVTGGTFIMTGGRITGNGCGGDGGGVYVGSGTFEINSPAKSGDVPDGSVTNNENSNVSKGSGGTLSGTGLATSDDNGW